MNGFISIPVLMDKPAILLDAAKATDYDTGEPVAGKEPGTFVYSFRTVLDGVVGWGAVEARVKVAMTEKAAAAFDGYVGPVRFDDLHAIPWIRKPKKGRQGEPEVALSFRAAGVKK